MHRPILTTTKPATAANPAGIHYLPFFTQMAKSLGDMIWNAAWKENRRFDRVQKRQGNSLRYRAVGLNGARAVARRLRQLQVTACRD